MGGVIFLAVIAGLIFISIKISNLKYRAMQHVLKDTKISSSNIDSEINSGFEKKYLQKFLQEYSNYTEESIKNLCKQYTIEIFNRNCISQFSQKVCEKMQTDSKLDKMKEMEFRRANITYYGNAKLAVMVVYTDSKDEYHVNLNCSILGETIQVEKYQINKGAVVGF